jgi:hypothetical protein
VAADALAAADAGKTASGSDSSSGSEGDVEDGAAGRDRRADASTSGGALEGGGGPNPHWQPQMSKKDWRRHCAARRREARGAAAPAPDAPPDRNMPPGAPPGLSRDALWDAAAGVISDLGDAEAAARVRGERHNWYRLMRVAQILLATPGAKLSDMDIDRGRELDYDFRWAAGLGAAGARQLPRSCLGSPRLWISAQLPAAGPRRRRPQPEPPPAPPSPPPAPGQVLLPPPPTAAAERQDRIPRGGDGGGGRQGAGGGRLGQGERDGPTGSGRMGDEWSRVTRVGSS